MPVREPPTTNGQGHESRPAEKGCPAPVGDPLATVKGVVNAILITAVLAVLVVVVLLIFG
jgi:hypothetical protein